MVETIRLLADIFKTMPEYFGKGLMELTILIVGGLIVGWFSSTIFARKAEIAEVEGTLFKKKLAIFEDLACKLEMFREQDMLPLSVTQGAIAILNQNGYKMEDSSPVPIMKIFKEAKRLTDTFLEFDRYVVAQRIYFDDETNSQLMIFQNYFAFYRRMIVMYEEHFIDKGISLENQAVKKYGDLLCIELGLLLQEEFSEQIDKVLSAIKIGVNNLSFKHRQTVFYGKKYFGEQGDVEKALGNTLVLKDRENIQCIIACNIALGMMTGEPVA